MSNSIQKHVEGIKKNKSPLSLESFNNGFEFDRR